MRRSHRTLTCAALLTLGLTGQSQAGFLDFLFGDQRQFGYQRPVYVPRYAPAPRSLPRDPDRYRGAAYDVDTQKDSREANLASIRKLDAIAKTEGVKAAFLKDQTARPGDIVMTAEGLAVYERGRDGAQLRPLADSRSKGRADLQALQKVSRLGSGIGVETMAVQLSDNRKPRGTTSRLVTAER